MVCLFLIMATLVVYWQVRNHEFVNFDDSEYITENRHAQAGLTWKGIIWAFTTTHASNWHPLTWLSHMLDCQIYGLNAGGHHLTSLLLHIVNTLLLFVVLNRLTGALWRSAFVAALFALHPLHVESVAWVAERKDVLSTFFWMLTMWAYIRYTERPGLNRYLLILLPFALGLMAKPMLVTLPFVLLLMDYWPLGRLQLNSLSSLWGKRAGVRGALWEKVPLFALAAGSSVVTFLVQQGGGALQSLDVLPFKIRIANTLVTYISYIVKMIWPLDLAVFYPHPGMWPIWQVLGAGLLLVCISVLLIRAARRRPYLAVGWLWYLGTLVPVIGVVQVGAQSMADRYTYVPLIGLFIIIAWGVFDLNKYSPSPGGRGLGGGGGKLLRLVLAICTGVALLVFAICTWLQVGHWQNSIALFQHTLGVTENNYLAHYNLGKAYGEIGHFKEEFEAYQEAIRINPRLAKAHYNIGVLFGRMGNYQEELQAYKQAIHLKPDHAKAYCNLGVAHAQMGHYSKAIWAFKEALRLNPNDKVVQQNLGVLYEKKGMLNNAIGAYQRALSIKPDFLEALDNLGNIYLKMGRIDKAIEKYKMAMSIKPDSPEPHWNLGLAYERKGMFDKAILEFQRYLHLRPDDAQARARIDNLLLQIDASRKAKKGEMPLIPGHP